jgi:hypothetical protein
MKMQLVQRESFPAMLVANLHIKRFDSRIQWRIRRIFEPETAKLLLSAISDDRAVVQEYYQHEAGHALGLGLALKDRLGLIDTPQQAGLEEYKTDVSGWRLAAAVLDPETVGKIVACTILIRWGIDFTRPGAPIQDHDAISALLILDRFLQSEAMYLTNARLLALPDVSFEGLFAATDFHRLEAEELVRAELDRLDDPRSIVAYYESKTARSETIELHRELIARCQDLTAEL